MKKGFTLIELLVYIALVSIVVIVAGKAFSDSAIFRVRTQSMVATAQTANDVIAAFKEDLSQMGTKSWKTASGTVDVFNVDTSVYIDLNNPDTALADTSSYVLTRTGDGLDSIAFRKMEYSEGGAFLGVRQVSWYVRDSVLWRSCKTLSGTENDDCKKSGGNPVKMADKVERFSITPATPGVSTAASAELLFPSSSSRFRLIPRTASGDLYAAEVSPDTGGTSVTISSFITNYDTVNAKENLTGKSATELYLSPAVAPGVSGTWNKDCKEFTFLPYETYAFEFNFEYSADNMRLFQPGKDHFSIGLRGKSDGSKVNGTSGVNDFMVYPPVTSMASTLRYGEFSVKDTTKACFALTVAVYSPLTQRGTITLKKFKVSRKLDASYHFETDAGNTYNLEGSVQSKKNVKAFRLTVGVLKRGEVGRATIVVPTPSNGAVATATVSSSSGS